MVRFDSLHMFNFVAQERERAIVTLRQASWEKERDASSSFVKSYSLFLIYTTY